MGFSELPYSHHSNQVISDGSHPKISTYFYVDCYA